jgi:hypothetical protein
VPNGFGIVDSVQTTLACLIAKEAIYFVGLRKPVGTPVNST